MGKILISINPFVMEQKVYLYANDGHRDDYTCSLSALDQEISKLANSENINLIQIHSSASSDFINRYCENIKKYSISLYGLDDLKIEII